MSDNNSFIWSGNSSAWIYVYPYLFMLTCAVILFPIHPLLSAATLAIMAGFIMHARSDRYSLSTNELTIKTGFSGEEFSIPLTYITHVCVIDPPPWHYFQVGWVEITVLDEEQNSGVITLRCIGHPLQVGALIETTAIAAGAAIAVEQPPS